MIRRNFIPSCLSALGLSLVSKKEIPTYYYDWEYHYSTDPLFRDGRPLPVGAERNHNRVIFNGHPVNLAVVRMVTGESGFISVVNVDEAKSKKRFYKVVDTTSMLNEVWRTCALDFKVTRTRMFGRVEYKCPY